MIRVANEEVPLMAETQETTSKTYNPFEPFRDLRDATLDAVAKAMVEAVNTEAYAQATGTMLEGYLTAVAPFREALGKSMLQALQQLELPSRQELAALAERFTNIEMRLDDMDAKLDAIGKALRPNGSMPQPTHKKQATEPEPVAAKPEAQAKAAAKRAGARRQTARRRARSPQR
ncbi:MAG: hypothetical protein WBG54_07755 [Acidobacteriaceae bacterium]